MKPPPPDELPPPDQVLAKPLPIRFVVWLAMGKALGLPIDELMDGLNLQLRAARRARGKGKAPFTLHERLQLAAIFKKLGRGIAAFFEWITTPEAIIRSVKRYQERKAQEKKEIKAQRPGRPPAGPEKVAAVLQIYGEGIRGLKRIRGELWKCGIELAKSTIRRILDQHGLPPGSNGKKGSTWAAFWRNHPAETIGLDFIQVAAGLWGNITYKFVLFAIEHDTRRVHLLGASEHPTDAWLQNVVRSATMDGEPLSQRRYWIHDNDGKFQTLRGILAGHGARSINTSVHAPDMNAFAERFIKSARDECLDHIIFFTEDHLRQSFEEYLAHYNEERPHQGIGNKPVGAWEPTNEGAIVCDERLGGAC